MTRQETREGNPHVWFDEGGVASVATPRRGPLLYMKMFLMSAAVAAGVTVSAATRYWNVADGDFMKYSVRAISKKGRPISEFNNIGQSITYYKPDDN